MQKFINIIDIGSEKITAVIGGRGVNGSFNIKTYLTENYAGFLNGELLDLTDLKLAIGSAITSIERSNKTNFDNCFIGIPAEFCICRVGEAELNFSSAKKINSSVVSELCDLALSSIKVPEGYSLINRSPIYFCGEDGRKTTEASKLKTDKIKASISFIFAKTELLKLLSKILRESGIFNFNFISSALAAGLHLFNADERESECLLIDVGYITTSILLMKGEGIIELSAFSLGGGNITAGLSECLKIKFKEAESLKRKVILSLDPLPEDVYNIELIGKTTPINSKLANEICEARIEEIASNISKVINSFENAVPVSSPAYLTGGGLTYLRGAKDYLSKLIARPVEMAKVPSLSHRQQTHSSAISVLNLGLLITEANKGEK